MEQKSSRRRRIASVLLTVWLSAGSGPVTAQEQDVPLLLAHRFTIAEPPSWSDVMVDRASGVVILRARQRGRAS